MPDIRPHAAGAKPADPKEAARWQPSACPLCDGRMGLYVAVPVARPSVTYFQCDGCAFVQVIGS